MLNWKKRNIIKQKFTMTYKNGLRNFSVWQYWHWKNEFYRHKTIFLKDIDIEKVLVSTKISFGKKKSVSTLLVTCIIMIKLGNYI